MTPTDLTPGGRGSAFYEAVTSEYDLTLADLETLSETARMLDLLDELREGVSKSGGPMVTNSRGDVIVNPGIVELRQVREAVRKNGSSLSGVDGWQVQFPGDEVDHRDVVRGGAVAAGPAFRGLHE